MEDNQGDVAKNEILLAKFVLEMHEINQQADKLEKAYRSAQERFKEITKRSDAMLADFEEAAKKNEKVLSEIHRHADVVAAQVTRMESGLKTIVAMDTFLKTFDVPQSTERMSGIFKNDMNELASLFDKLIENRLQEMLTKLMEELKKNHQAPIVQKISIPPVSKTIIEWKSLIELYREVGRFPFFVLKNGWTGDYYARIDTIVNGNAKGVPFKNGQQYQQKSNYDANEYKYRLYQSPNDTLDDDDLPF